jgi:hypothetical protein
MKFNKKMEIEQNKKIFKNTLHYKLIREGNLSFSENQTLYKCIFNLINDLHALQSHFILSKRDMTEDYFLLKNWIQNE